MDVFEALSALTTTPGVTGNEVAVSEVVKGYYKAYTDDIFIDPMGNTYAHIGDHGPVLLVQAHMDEVGMMVTDIEEDGMPLWAQFRRTFSNQATIQSPIR